MNATANLGAILLAHPLAVATPCRGLERQDHAWSATVRDLAVSLFVAFGLGSVARADVVASEFASMPLDDGWELVQTWCEPIEWVADGWYHQNLGNNSCQPPDIGQVSYVRSIESFVGAQRWFYEFRVSTTGDRSEIPGGAPTVLVAFNAFGEDYTATVAKDQVKLFRDALLPVLFFDLTPGVPHTIRLELDNTNTPTYEWFVDSVSVDSGDAEDIFPSDDARITWRGKAWFLPTENAWDYIRYGEIPTDGSGDFNSDGTVDDFETFYINECIERSAAGEPAYPSCSWADVNGDNSVTCNDWQMIQDSFWTSPNEPPLLTACPTPIPAVSQWGAAVLTLLTLTAATLVFSRQRREPTTGSLHRTCPSRSAPAP